jgi:hypothetical protein
MGKSLVEDYEDEKSRNRKGVIANGDGVRIPMTLMDGKSHDAAAPAHGYAAIIARLDDATAAEAKHGLGLIQSNDANSVRYGIDQLSALLRSRAGMVASGLVTDSAERSALQRSAEVLDGVVAAARQKLHQIETSRSGK